MRAPAEQWRPIADFPDYAVSDAGRVMRVVDRGTSRAGRVLKHNLIYGYHYVGLTLDGVAYSRRVHRLVCAAFHGPAPSPQHHAAHGDGDKSNNRVANVRWATASENMRDKELHDRVPRGDRNGARRHPDRLARGARNGKYTKPERTPRGEAHGCSRLTTESVRAIRSDPRSRRQIAAAYGVSKCAIDGVKTGKTWSHVQ